MWGRLREIFISRGTARYPVGGSSAALLLEVEGFLIRKGLQPGSERSNMECNFIFFFYLKISGTCRIFSWTGNTSKRPVTNSDWELEKHLLDKNRSEQPPTWTNVANNRVGMDHGTFMSVLTGREGFLNKQKYSSVD